MSYIYLYIVVGSFTLSLSGRGDHSHSYSLTSRITATALWSDTPSMFIRLQLDQHSRLRYPGDVLQVGTALLIEPNIKVLSEVWNHLKEVDKTPFNIRLVLEDLSPSAYFTTLESILHGSPFPQVTPPSSVLFTEDDNFITNGRVINRSRISLPTFPAGDGEQQGILTEHPVEWRTQDASDEYVSDSLKDFLRLHNKDHLFRSCYAIMTRNLHLQQSS